MINDYVFPVFSFFSLGIAMFCYWTSLAFPKQNRIFQVGSLLVWISTLLLICTLALRWWQQKYFPLSNLYESLLFLSWALSSIHLFFEFQTQSRISGAIATPFLFLLTGFASFTLPLEMQKALPLVPSLQSNWLMMHVSMMMVSYATLLVGSLFSILYLCFFFSLPFKEKEEADYSVNRVLRVQWKNSGLENILSEKEIEEENKVFRNRVFLQTLDLWSYRILGFGFPCLTLGILSGAVWANEAWGSYWSWDPKETWALITWLTFASYLHSRFLRGWKGKNAAFLAACGFFVIWICYLGVNFLGKGLHTYGWVF